MIGPFPKLHQYNTGIFNSLLGAIKLWESSDCNDLKSLNSTELIFQQMWLLLVISIPQYLIR